MTDDLEQQFAEAIDNETSSILPCDAEWLDRVALACAQVVMKWNHAESILRKLKNGGYFGLTNSDDMTDHWLTVDNDIVLTEAEAAYLRSLEAKP